MVFAVLAALAVAALVLNARHGVETDLLGLVDSQHAGVLREIASGAARQGRVLVEGPAKADLSQSAEKILEMLAQPRAGAFKDTLAVFAANGAGLLSAQTRERLAAGRYAEVEADMLARLFGPVPPLFGLKADPFLFITDYVLSLEKGMPPGWSFRNGYPAREVDDRAYLLLTVDLQKVPPGRICEFLATAAKWPPPVRVFCGGAAFHAAATAENARREINGLSVASVVAVLAIGFWLFRSVGFVPRLVCTLGVAGLLAMGALFWLFPRPHVLTFVFGTSLIGLSVDYVYHACAAGGAGKVWRPLTLAMLTTVAAFVPLMFAAVNVLRQMAWFTMVGLVAAWGWELFGDWRMRSPSGRSARRDAYRRGRIWRWMLAGGVLLASVWGLPRLKVVSDPAAFYRPTPYLAESERVLARLAPDDAGRFAYVKGANLQEALEREEEAGVKGLSALVPSLRRQRENLDLVRRFINAVGKDYLSKAGMGALAGRIGDLMKGEALLDPECVEDARIQGLVQAMWTGGGLISPCRRDFTIDSPYVEVLEPRRSLSRMFKGFTDATGRLLWWSWAVMAGLLLIFFRRRFWRHLAPLAAAMVATAGTLGLLGLEMTFFTMLCFFVLAGLGVDYVIFHQDGGEEEVGRTVLGSFLTSLIGLGALSFTGFVVTASMGVTFAVGLSYAWFFAWTFSWRDIGADEHAASDASAWHEQREQSAGAWRLAFMWWVYRLLGKNALKVMCVPVMLFIYPFAAPARRALAEFRGVLREYAGKSGRAVGRVPCAFMHLLSFAWSLVDKTDVCTLHRALPEVEIREDDGFRAFAELVAKGRGAFLISTHLGTVEVLPALALSSAVKGLPRPRLHAFQQLGHDAQFTRRFMQNFRGEDFELHAVESIGVETAVAMQSAVARGELVLMAGDRTSAGSAKTLAHDFLARPCVWPKGVFTFALLLDSPIFFVTCVHVGRNRYEAHFAEWKDAPLPDGKANAKRRRLESLLGAYVDFLESETLRYPGQWYQFYSFFRAHRDSTGAG